MVCDSQVVQQTELKVNVSYKTERGNLQLNEPLFSEVEKFYSDKKPKENNGILRYHTLNSLLQRLNTLQTGGDKEKNVSILKGIYKGGTAGKYCELSAPFLFFDIDVKTKGKKENAHLSDPVLNTRVFSELEKISIFTFRSNSGLGISGLLYVPKLAGLSYLDNRLHLKIGRAVLNAVNNILTKDCKVKFDEAQNKFRQIRFLAEQKHPVKINLNPLRFDIDVIETPVITKSKIKAYRFENYQSVKGSIEQQFNEMNDIKSVLIGCGFTELQNNRFKHPRTSSNSSGLVDVQKNIYVNFSTSFNQYKTVFTPYQIQLTEKYCNNENAFFSDLRKAGYKTIEPNEKDVKTAENALKTISKTERDKQIFRACYHLRNLPIEKKHQFIKNNCKNDDELPLFYEYLKLKNTKITFDKTLQIDNYVSESLNAVLDYSDKHKKVIVKAETGTGKTTAFLKHFKELRPHKRCLIIAPLTAIVNQTASEYKEIIGLTGKSAPETHRKAFSSVIVVSTIEQAVKHLKNGNLFEYLIIDEVHNLIIANGYKLKAIKELTELMEKSNSQIIGLTGTPIEIFKLINFKLINIEKRKQKPVKIIKRNDNRAPYKIIMQHLSKISGKAIFRVNSKATLKSIYKDLTKRFSKKEVVLLYSAEHIKNSTLFSELTQQRRFKDEVKIILTTSIIDEGLSIEQIGFSDVVFIETQYNPNPEPAKQFFARFRNKDDNRKNYYYYRKTDKKKIENWSYKYDFIECKNTLEAESEILKDLTENSTKATTYNDLANDSKYFNSDFSVNNFVLAYDVHKRYFQQFNEIEYCNYLSENFNISIIQDEQQKDLIDQSEHTEKRKKDKELITEYWHNYYDEVVDVVYNSTTKKEVKSILKPEIQCSNDELAVFVIDNISDFEYLFKTENRLLTLAVENPNGILFEYLNQKPKARQKVNAELKVIETIKLIENPKTPTDQRNRDKILNFINELKKLKAFTLNDVRKLFKRQKITNASSYQTYVLKEIVNHFLNIKYDTKLNFYEVKE
jgi:hypothetical protein